MSFGLLFQTLLPATGLPSAAGKQALAALCSVHLNTTQSGVDGPSSAPDDPHSALCRSLCALAGGTQFLVAPDIGFAVVAPATRSQRLHVGADDRRIIIRAATGYSSRAPPAAA